MNNKQQIINKLKNRFYQITMNYRNTKRIRDKLFVACKNAVKNRDILEITRLKSQFEEKNQELKNIEAEQTEIVEALKILVNQPKLSIDRLTKTLFLTKDDEENLGPEL